ncbi:hypothetical protein UFOVP28_52 [uncultured Caudovirales phage]|uniref:Uncharacterized protein n=1 Tax=uncultured Caudovirales phage TaxID=2100421 RepID=A0A6J5KRX1_9CAUD|nr:hypothetical protein UFOVP28_52 [uncultured Caudovirales phage]
MGLTQLPMVALIAFLLGTGLAGGTVWHYRDLRDQAEALARERALHKKVDEGVLIEGQHEAKQIVVEHQIETKYETIKEAVPVYIDRINPVVSSNFVLLHDAAAVGDAPAAPSPDDTPSAIKTDQALSTIVDNYKSCQIYIERLKGWQDWWKDVSK